MASRRSDRESSGFARKFFTWVAVIVFVIWAARNPAQAATLFHTIASAFASLASHSKHGH
jgi:plasmid stabilization system protein ParE